MLKIRLRIHKIDGASVEYRVTPRTMVAFEKEYKVSITKAFSADNIHVEHLYWLAWDAERVAGNVVPLFDKWLETVASVDMVTDTVPLDETA